MDAADTADLDTKTNEKNKTFFFRKILKILVGKPQDTTTLPTETYNKPTRVFSERKFNCRQNTHGIAMTLHAYYACLLRTGPWENGLVLFKLQKGFHGITVNFDELHATEASRQQANKKKQKAEEAKKRPLKTKTPVFW